MADAPAPFYDVLTKAAAVAGISAAGAVLIRDGSNVLYAVPGGMVARIGRSGGKVVAEKEVVVSQWLTEAGVSVVRAVSGVVQPVVVDGRPVTWWDRLPEHRAATPAELGVVLRALHGLPIPAELELAEPRPLDRVQSAIDAADFLPAADRAWLRYLLTDLCEQYANLPPGRSRCVIHGDAWQGNVAATDAGPPILLDLEHVGVGPPEYDLVPLATDYIDFARLGRGDYRAFTDAYGGYDVTTWAAFRTLATVNELRWTSFVLGKADGANEATTEAKHRIACLRGEVGRPWSWSAF